MKCGISIILSFKLIFHLTTFFFSCITTSYWIVAIFSISFFFFSSVADALRYISFVLYDDEVIITFFVRLSHSNSYVA